MKILMLMGDSTWDNDIPLEEPVINAINVLTKHYGFIEGDCRLIDGSTISPTSIRIISSCTIFKETVEAYSNELALMRVFWDSFMNGDEIVAVSIDTSTNEPIMQEMAYLINRYEIPNFLILLPNSHHEMEGF